MGTEQSKHDHGQSSLDKKCDVEKNFETEADPSEIMWKKVVAIEIEEKLKVFDTRIEVLELENNNLKAQVAALKGKIESSEEKELERVNKVNFMSYDFETRIKRLESQAKPAQLPVPPFPQTQIPGAGCLDPIYSEYSSKILPINPLFNQLSEGTIKEATIIANMPLRKPKIAQKKILSLPYYDHPLPTELVNLCKVDRCDLCQLNLNSQVMANEHYWGKKHFRVVHEYLENYYRETPELKPKYKQSSTYNRPLPLAIISQSTEEKCGLCNKTFLSRTTETVQEHYYGNQHEKQVLHFLQKNPHHWQEGFLQHGVGWSTSAGHSSARERSEGAESCLR